MPYRLLTDSTGRAWEIWEVHPEFAERRRTAALPPDVTGDRRRRAEYRVPIAEAWSDGWLAFESQGEKRRLAPIPVGWDRLSDPELQGLLEAAEAGVPRRTRRLIE